MKKTIITISREFGSGGHFIGEEVAKRMNIPYYDKDIISRLQKKPAIQSLSSRNNPNMLHRRICLPMRL